MSWNTNGTGYTNGSNSASDRLRRYGFNDSSRDTSADERSRSRGPGGYGGFGTQGAASSGVRAPSRLNRGHATRKSREEGTWSNSRSRSRPGGLRGQAGSQVEGQSALYIGYDVYRLLRPHSQRFSATSSSSGPSWLRRPVFPSRSPFNSTTGAPSD
jgi:hypothetical protein